MQYLTETKIRYSSKSELGSKRINLYSQNTNIPTIIIYVIEEDKKYFVITPRKRVFEKKLKEAGARGDMTLYKTLSKIKHFISGLRSHSYTWQEALEICNLEPQLLIAETISKHELYKKLTVDYNFSDSGFEKSFGTIEAKITDQISEKIAGFNVFFPDKMRESRKNNFIKILLEIEKLFKKFKVDKTLYGNIKFGKINGKAIGTYFLQSKELRIDNAGAASKMLKATIIHELGHKYYYEVNTTAAAKANEQFYYIRKNELDTPSPVPPLNSIVINKTNKKYIGKYKIVSNGVFSSSGKIKLVGIDDENKSIQLTAPNWISFVKHGFMSNDEEFNKVKIRPSTTEENMPVTDEWIPSNYSMTNQSEWFAEMFTAYLLGKLKGEPLEFMKKIIN